MIKNNCIFSFIYPVIASTPTECLYISTGFLYRKNTDFYFITSLSTVLGRNIPNGDFKFNKKKIPDSLETNFSIFKEDLTSINKRAYPIKILIYDDNAEPNFFIHPIYKKEIDVAVFPINAKGMDFVALNDFDVIQEKNNNDVFVIGYPLFPNKSDDKTIPVIETSQILNEHKKTYNINSIKRIGMYGSAVFKKTNLNENAFCFLGICSGCDSLKKTDNSQTVWKKSLIEEIILSKYKESCLD